MEDDIRMLEHYKNNLSLQIIYKMYKKSLQTKKTSYIPYLINIDDIVNTEINKGMCPKKINSYLTAMRLENKHNVKLTYISETSSNFNLKNKETYNIIKEAQRNMNDYSNDDVNAIINEIKRRNDLFDNLLKVTDEEDEFYDDLYYWHPDREINDIYTLLLSCFKKSKLLTLYKEYIKKSIILKQNYSLGLYKLIEMRYNSSLLWQIDVIKNDSKYVTHEFWCDSDAKFKIEERLKKENFVKDERIIGDVIIEFKGCLSYVEVEIKNKCYLVKVEELNGLVEKSEKYKKFWHDKGIKYD